MSLNLNTKLLFARVALLMVALLSGVSAAIAEESDVQDVASNAISVVTSVPYAEDSKIRKKITQECTKLGTKLASFIQSYSNKKGIEINLVDAVDTSAAGKVLQLEISDAVSRGNAFIGHQKFVEVRGTLWENGQAVASFEGQRSSMGGFAAGYKSSCSVLGRCVKALGKDISAWLANPQDDAVIGE